MILLLFKFYFPLLYLGTHKHFFELTDIIDLQIVGKMILIIKKNTYQIFKLTFLVSLTYIPHLYAHNFINGGCKEHCESKVEAIINENNLNNVYDQEEIDSKNSCLNKSLCRG